MIPGTTTAMPANCQGVMRLPSKPQASNTVNTGVRYCMMLSMESLIRRMASYQAKNASAVENSAR